MRENSPDCVACVVLEIEAKRALTGVLDCILSSRGLGSQVSEVVVRRHNSVVSQNIRRRHLTAGQLASIALEWADELEKAGGLPPVTDENGPKQAGRPKSVLAEAARKLGINERAADLRMR